jgi:hypothetical protein
MKVPTVASEKSFAALFRRPGLVGLREYLLVTSGHGFSHAVSSTYVNRLQPLKNSLFPAFRSHSARAATLDEGPR